MDVVSATTHAWCALRDLTGNGDRAVTIDAWRDACGFTGRRRCKSFWDARRRLEAQRLIKLHSHGYVRLLPGAPRAMQPRRPALRGAPLAPGRCPVCTRDAVRLRRHATIGGLCFRCDMAANMLRDSATAQRLADALAMLA